MNLQPRRTSLRLCARVQERLVSRSAGCESPDSLPGVRSHRADAPGDGLLGRTRDGTGDLLADLILVVGGSGDGARRATRLRDRRRDTADRVRCALRCGMDRVDLTHAPDRERRLFFVNAIARRRGHPYASPANRA